MIKTCDRCGCEFAANHALTKYCAPCRHAVKCEADVRYRATHPKASIKPWDVEQPKSQPRFGCDKAVTQKKVDEATGKPVKTLDDWAREAAECNLDYGTYRALIAAGKTFEQLKVEQRSPQFHSHCRHPYGF